MQKPGRYSREGKIEYPISDEQFKHGMQHGKFVHVDTHRPFCVLLFYSAVRASEARRALRDQFQVTPDRIMFHVGERLKKAKHFKVCNCQTRNAVSAKFCRQCGADISSLEPQVIKPKVVSTPDLPLSLAAPYMNELKDLILATSRGERLFKFCDKTGYNVVRRAFKYPHLFRLSRITRFYAEGYTTEQVHSWTGLSLAALEYYLGLASLAKMGDSLAHSEVAS